jgi:hypothetical protein
MDGYRRFGGQFSLHLRISTMKTEVVGSSETSVCYRNITCRNNTPLPPQKKFEFYFRRLKSCSHSTYFKLFKWPVWLKWVKGSAPFWFLALFHDSFSTTFDIRRRKGGCCERVVKDVEGSGRILFQNLQDLREVKKRSGYKFPWLKIESVTSRIGSRNAAALSSSVIVLVFGFYVYNVDIIIFIGCELVRTRWKFTYGISDLLQSHRGRERPRDLSLA